VTSSNGQHQLPIRLGSAISIVTAKLPVVVVPGAEFALGLSAASAPQPAGPQFFSMRDVSSSSSLSLCLDIILLYSIAVKWVPIVIRKINADAAAAPARTYPKEAQPCRASRVPEYSTSSDCNDMRSWDQSETNDDMVPAREVWMWRYRVT